MKHSRLLFAFLFFIVFCSCENRMVKQSLRAAGNNRQELEKVIEHFSKDPADSLKLKAAQFLIGNMPGHFSFIDDGLMAYYDSVANVSAGQLFADRHLHYCMPNILYEADALDVYPQDVEAITSEMLIAHINARYDIWQKSPWVKSVCFEDFCEYILPYRVLSEPLDYVNGFYYSGSQIDSIYRIVQNHSIMTAEYATYAKAEILKIQRGRQPLSGYSDALGCAIVAYSDILMFRSIGLPAAVDFAPHWSRTNNRHSWSVLVGPNMLPTVIDTRNYAKVYRRTYSHNHSINNIRKNEYVPAFFTDPFNKDVTEQYARTQDVSLKLNLIKGSPKYTYLAVFNTGNWEPVIFAELNGRKAAFPNMGTDNVYLPIYYGVDEDSQRAAGWPFILQANGNIIYFTPDYRNTQSMELTRKYHIGYFTLERSNSMEGAVISLSQDQSFDTADTIATMAYLDTAPFYNYDINVDKKYKYLKITTPHKYAVKFAEMTVFDDKDNSVELSLVDSGNTARNEAVNPVRNLLDGDMLTLGCVNKFLTFELPDSIMLSRVEMAMHNDDNYIMPGELYELLYWDKDGWKSAGEQTATEHKLTFDNVPSNALYLLRNYTKGIEERIFTYENGRQIWW